MGIHRVGFGTAADVRVAPAPTEGTWAGTWVGRTVASAAHGHDAGAVVTVAPDTPCSEADERARVHGVRHLFVVENEKLVGIICRCDLYPEPDPHEEVSTRMSSNVYALDPAATLGEAAAAMKTLGVGCLPVVHHERPVGLVTRGDLRRAGVPEPELGAQCCLECGSVHGVRTDAHSGLEYCLDCIDLFTAMGNDYGEGD
ncbi:MAG TPA: CBS domain-containing protein [Polyangia bacterium]|nr:CBS domain-containing protein [Polyangia bacterium]